MGLFQIVPMLFRLGTTLCCGHTIPLPTSVLVVSLLDNSWTIIIISTTENLLRLECLLDE